MIKKKQLNIFSDGSTIFDYKNLLQINIYKHDFKNFHLNKKKIKTLLESKYS